MILYIYPVICNVVLLRNHGTWRSRNQVRAEPGERGWLDFRKADPARWGRTWQARLISTRTVDKDLLPVLQHARVLTIKDGGVMIEGREISSRGAKSKPVETLQTWWCVIHQEEGYAALERMNPRCSTGFHVNDDDDEGLLPPWPK